MHAKNEKPHDPPPKAGWGFVALQNGDGGADDHAQEVYKAWGPVATDTNDAYHIGAERTTNNTAELSALAHALAWARVLSSAVLFVALSAPIW